MRADGSVIISAVNNKVEVTGGDQTVIIEGNGNLVYQGNLNMKVTGDYNVDIGGNYNVNVGGSLREDIHQNHRTVVTGNREETVKKTKTNRTLSTVTDVMLADHNLFVKLDQKNFVEGNIEIAAEDNILISGKEAVAISSKNANITGAKYVSVMGQKGAIGGRMVDFTGNVFQGGEGPVEFNSGANFYGTFYGKASEAWKANNANNADLALRSYYAANAKAALTAVTAGTASEGPSSFITPKILSAGIHMPKFADEYQYPSSGPAEVQITGEWVVGQVVNGDYAIRTVVVDGGDVLLQKILLSDDYKNVFDKHPTTQEIRSAFSKNGGSLGETGSLGFVFKRKGVIKFKNDQFDENSFFELAADAGAEDIISEDNEHTAICISEDFGSVRDSLTEKIGNPTSAKLEWVPQNVQPINEEQAEKILSFIDILEDNDDVQTVYTNLEVSEEIMDKIKNK